MSDFITKEDLIKKGKDNGVDLRKVAQWGIGLLILGIFGYYIAPILTTIAWNLNKLAAAAVVTFLVVSILANKNVRRRLGYINEFVAKILLGWMIEWDEFRLQEMQIEQAEKDVEKMVSEKEKVQGKYIELVGDVNKNKEALLEAVEMEKIAAKEGDNDAVDDARSAQIRANDFITTIEPITLDMKFIIDTVTEMNKILKRKIKNAKQDLQSNKAIYTAANAGASALNSAKRAFMGDVGLNSDAEVAKQRIKEKIALSIGQMRTSMEILNDVSKETNLKDKAKMAVAKQRLQQLNLSNNDSNSEEDGMLSLPIPQQSINFQGIQPAKKYSDLI